MSEEVRLGIDARRAVDIGLHPAAYPVRGSGPHSHIAALPLDDKQTTEDAITVVNVLGDDFSVGSDVADEPAWPQIMARMQGWTVNVSAIARTGYVQHPRDSKLFSAG